MTRPRSPLPAPPWLLRESDRLRRSIDKPVRVAFVCTLLLLLASSLYSTNFLSPTYLLQQLQIAAFLGVVATGAMLVILIGGIDLSVPWAIALGGVMASAAGGSAALAHGEWLAIPVGIGCGALLGSFNGFGVGYLRVPSMIFTLGSNAVAQGLVVLQTGGFAPNEGATLGMHRLATGRSLFVPNALLVWMAIGGAALFILHKSAIGRAIYAIGNRERAAYLSGIDTRRTTLLVFTLAGALSGLGGVLLAGYSNKAYQGMGDAYLMPAIAAVVLGGTHIQGGKGSYLGTVLGVILITLLGSILSVMQIPELGRQIVYGGVILGLLLAYGRGQRDTV
jgi:ribose transport system permease protein